VVKVLDMDPVMLMLFMEFFVRGRGGEEADMTLSSLILATIFVLLFGAVASAMVIAFRTSLRYHGKRVVTCPETQKPAAIHVNVGRAARQAILGKTEIRLDQCSRWPEKKDCGQGCLEQIHADPEHCLVWNMVSEWYEGKACAYCQKPFGEIHWHEHHPVVLAPDRTCVQWDEIPAEKLPEIFRSYSPVCWNCYIAETFRRQNRDRVLDRKWERGASGEYTPKEIGGPESRKAPFRG